MVFNTHLFFHLKKAFDFLAALFLLALFAPLLLVLACLVRLLLGSPIFFIQKRTGINAQEFSLYKLRTMKANPPGLELSDAERMTAFGAFLRQYSLDELPQLINVVRGELSLVGPRPLLPEYTALYDQQQIRRLSVRPGITGWAQVNGRNSLSWPEKFKLDVWYIDHWSLWLDAKILFLTVVKVFSASGVNSGPGATMEKFKGNVHEHQ